MEGDRVRGGTRGILIGALTEDILGVPVPVPGVFAGDERTNIAGSVSSASRV